MLPDDPNPEVAVDYFWYGFVTLFIEEAWTRKSIAIEAARMIQNLFYAKRWPPRDFKAQVKMKGQPIADMSLDWTVVLPKN